MAAKSKTKQHREGIKVEQVVEVASVFEPIDAFTAIHDEISRGSESGAGSVEFRFDYNGIRHTVTAEVID
jgi:hypothetical protein